ncbi:MAG: 4'-phosphopantetheinyl transferase superfamily protein [Clostridiales bacterium]|nr:4'-phosphopantetheinyl transferase superfamily protein [Clostridiales bacterium]
MKCIYFDVNELNIGDNFRIAYNSCPWMNPLEKIDRLKCLDDKLLSLGVNLLLAYAFREKGVDYIRLRYEEGCKPFLRGRQDFYFNCSHSGNLAVIAYADSSLGVDVEKIRPVNKKVATRLFTKKEQGLVVDDESFMRLWTKKESYVKNTGRGRIQMSEVEVLPSSPDMQGLTFSEKVVDNHIITVCHAETEKAEWKQVYFNEL